MVRTQLAAPYSARSTDALLACSRLTLSRRLSRSAWLQHTRCAFALPCARAASVGLCARHSHASMQAQDAAYASTALRKGERLLKYCRRGRPHACHVQLSPDECEVEWVSGAAKPRTLRLASVKDVVAGQTTAVFRSGCCPCPLALAATDRQARTSRRRLPGLHKPSLSFSVIYCEPDGAERSLDLVCKACALRALRRARERRVAALSLSSRACLLFAG